MILHRGSFSMEPHASQLPAAPLSPWDQEIDLAHVRGDRRFQALIEKSWDAVIVMDGEAVIRYASPSATRVLAYPPETLLGQFALDLVHPEERSRMTDLFRQ